MASPKRLEARKAEAIEKLVKSDAEIIKRLDRIEKKLDKLLGNKAEGKQKADEPEAKPAE